MSQNHDFTIVATQVLDQKRLKTDQKVAIKVDVIEKKQIEKIAKKVETIAKKTLDNEMKKAKVTKLIIKKIEKKMIINL